MAFYIIRTIARYEMRTLLRSWFFRIFAGMSIMGLGLFNAGLNFPGSGSPMDLQVDCSLYTICKSHHS